MQVLHESSVLDSEIDSLGHMNVRYYLSRIDQASERLMQALGLLASVQPGTNVRRQDTYSRFRQEQFAGAVLQVRGGVLEQTAEFVRAYYEIHNPSKSQIAASFITSSTLVDAATQQPALWPLQAGAVNEQYGVRLPQGSKPRSLSLEPPNTNITLTQLQQRVPDNPTPGMMSGRRDAVIDPADCDLFGFLREDVDLMFVMHKPQPGAAVQSFGPPVLKTDEGHRFSWAMIETRAMVLGRPKAQDNLVSIGADIAYGPKWRQSRRWAFVKNSQQLVGVNDVVGIALDLDERRSIEIPPSIRLSIEQNYLPDLA